MPRTIAFILLAIPFLTLIQPVHLGKVVHITDTLKVLVNQQQIKVRLAEIDAPEDRLSEKNRFA